jgi:hypothetical protein
VSVSLWQAVVSNAAGIAISAIMSIRYDVVLPTCAGMTKTFDECCRLSGLQVILAKFDLRQTRIRLRKRRGSTANASRRYSRPGDHAPPSANVLSARM